MVQDQSYYKNGFNKAISDTHASRTVSNSAGFVIPILEPNHKLLDVGCGPGSITLDFANYVEGGEIIGVEPTEELIDLANENKAKLAAQGKKVDNVKFQIGSIYQLPFEDNSFDVVYAHQVVIHLEDPIAGLKELKRVTKPNGFVCVRDADLESTTIFPQKYEDTLRFWFTSKAAKSTDTRAGRSLKSKAIKAGYISENIKASAWIWCVSDAAARAFSAKGSINRIQNSGENLKVGDEETNKKKKQEIIQAWTEFADDEEGYFTMQGGEIVYQKEA